MICQKGEDEGGVETCLPFHLRPACSLRVSSSEWKSCEVLAGQAVWLSDWLAEQNWTGRLTHWLAGWAWFGWAELAGWLAGWMNVCPGPKPVRIV